MLLAIVSGLAPGIIHLHLDDRVVDRRQVVHREPHVASTPKRITETVKTAVITGRRMKGSEKFMTPPPRSAGANSPGAPGSSMWTLASWHYRELPVDDHSLARLQSFSDNHRLILLLAQLHRPQFRVGSSLMT